MDSRVSGRYFTGELRPRVRLMSATEHPIGTLFSMWHASRHSDYITPRIAQAIVEENYWEPAQSTVAKYIESCYPEHGAAQNIVRAVAKMNLQANVPAAEAVHFSFIIDDCSVALREQMVRSKLSSFWMQTSRTADLTSMDINRSEAIQSYGGEVAMNLYNETADSIRKAYESLEEMGVPSEEIRLAPEARVHRVMWMIDARSLMLVLNKRVDWMAQATLWEPIVTGVISALRSLDPVLADFYGKPPGVGIRDGVVVSHAYDNENEDRYYGRDPQPVDPLWLAYKGLRQPGTVNWQLYEEMKVLYRKLWSNEVLAVVGWDRYDQSVVGPYDVS